MVTKLDKFKKKISDLRNFTTIIFDLDNTIYEEINYLKFAYIDISKKIVSLNNNLNESDIYNFLLNTFLNEGRKNLYQKLIEEFKIINFGINNFLHSLRNVSVKENSIKIYPIIENFIIKNINNFNFCIATNGHPDQQRNKLKSINLPHKEKFFVVYCNELGEHNKKPSPAFVDVIVQKFGVIKKQLLFIGDSEIDRQAAIEGNINFMYIKDFISILRKDW